MQLVGLYASGRATRNPYIRNILTLRSKGGKQDFARQNCGILSVTAVAVSTHDDNKQTLRAKSICTIECPRESAPSDQRIQELLLNAEYPQGGDLLLRKGFTSSHRLRDPCIGQMKPLR